MHPEPTAPRIAVVLPCCNEALSIGAVLDEFARHLPGVPCYVFDNRSTDGTADVARRHGAEVVHVALQGKGNVVRRMLADVEADCYVMVDGDATYDLSGLAEHVRRLFADGLDMVVGCRKDDRADPATYRIGHRWGNRMLTGTVAWLFGDRFSDMLSGYRLFSRRFAKSFPAAARGFETETELTVHALELRMPCTEVPVAYRSRPQGSESKLSTYRDGVRILLAIVRLTVSERPFEFFAAVAVALALLAALLIAPVLVTYLQTGLVPRLPTAILSMGLMLAAGLSTVTGTVLHTVTMGRREAKQLAYLAIRGPLAQRAGPAATHA